MNFTVSVDPQSPSATDKEHIEAPSDSQTDTLVSNVTVPPANAFTSTLPAPVIRNDRRLIIDNGIQIVGYILIH